MELNQSLTTTELEKPQPSRLVGGARMWNRLVTHPCVVDKYLEWIVREPGVPTHTSPPAQDSSARKISPHNFWLQKQGEIGGRNFWSSKQFLLKNLPSDSPTQTHFFWVPAWGWQVEGHQWYTGRDWGVWCQGKQRPLSLCWVPPTLPEPVV